MLAYRSCSWQAIVTDVLGMKRSTAAKIVSKLLNFQQKQLRMGIAQELLTTFNDDPDLLKKVVAGDESCVWLWHWNQSPIIPIKARQIQVNVKVLLTVCFNCHKIVRSIRNTTLKLCTDCSKQFVRNAQNCEKTNHEFCIMTTDQLTHWYLCVSFWPKLKP